MPQKVIHVVGFGSHGSAWTECLKSSGWSVQVYLSQEGKGYQKAKELGFNPHLLPELPKRLQAQNEPACIAMLCPDSAIAGVYFEYLAHLDLDLTLILAHGFAIFTGELQFKNPEHKAALLAPKAIGPKLLQNFKDHFPQPHGLCAGFYAPFGKESALIDIARGLGISSQSLIPATFQQETLGDLISEQGLLCGGVFNLLNWTIEAMVKAGVPDALIREECLTELELVAGLIRERGPASAFQAISQAAQCGTVALGNSLAESGLKKQFLAQMEDIQNQKFTQYFQSGQWRPGAQKLIRDLSHWQDRLNRK
jgi:ketol-acid reductoisomerase